MSKITWKPGALLNPVPSVLVSCGDINNMNILTIGWTGIINTIPPMTYISVRPERYSYELIKNSGEFVINLTNKKLVKAVDFAGVRSGRNIDKFKELGLTPEKASIITSPMIMESPVSIECKVKEIIPLGSHHMFLADIVATNIDEQYIDENGKLHLDKANLITYSHGEYFELGQKLGTFGFSVRKKKKKKKNFK